MEHNDNEHHANRDGYKSAEQLNHDANASASDGVNSGMPLILARLGLNSTTPSLFMADGEVMNALNNPEWTVRLDAIQQLKALPEHAQIQALLRALHDDHENVRAAAARALNSYAFQTAVEPLIEALRDPAWTVRAAAIQALAKRKGQVPLESLVTALRDSDVTVRATAAWALGTLGKQAPLLPLVNALHDSSWPVREAAVLALGELGTRVPAPLLLAAQNDSDESVRQAAELVLQRTYPELLVSSPVQTIAATSVIEGSDNQHAKLNGYNNYHPKIIQPAKAKQSGRALPSPLRATKRLFPRVAALVAATLVIIATMFSWLVVSHQPQRAISGHPSVLATSGISTFHTASGPVYRVVWSPDGTKIASTNAAGLVQMRDALTGHLISTYRGNFLKVLSLAWLPDHALLVAAQASDRSVQVWNALTAQRIVTTPPLQSTASTATWSPDGSQVAFDGGDNTVQVWNIVTGKKVLTYNGHSGHINALSWSPDGSEIASASDDQTVQVWNAATGNKDWPSFVHTDAVSVVAWSPDNTRCAVSTANGAVEVWDNPSWNKAQIASPNIAQSNLNHPLVAFIAWSPDGTHLAFATSGGPVQVWDASVPRLLYTYPGHTGQVNDVVWSPDGTHIASANADGSVQVWPIPYITEISHPGPANSDH